MRNKASSLFGMARAIHKYRSNAAYGVRHCVTPHRFRSFCLYERTISMSARKKSRRSGEFAMIGLLAIGSLVGGVKLHAQDTLTLPTEDHSGTEALRKQIVEKGLAFLCRDGQSKAGTFSEQVGPGVTALALTSALRNGRDGDDPMVAKALKALEAFIKPDGGIYGNGRLRNYETCVAMMCFVEANKNGQYTEVLKRAKAFVTRLQFDGATRDASDPSYGGVGYGGESRPDMSNTAYLIEALRSTESSPDDPAIQAALRFISRCQNLDSEYNDTSFAGKVNDGGFYYVIPSEKIDPSTSDERYTPNGGLRSYGSMGYAGLKSMIFAGLTPEDIRVKAAMDWITKRYDVKSNPGMGSSGLYYYYHTFAAALSTAKLDTLKDADGVEHNWRDDLVAELAKRQNPDGSWSNDNQRWFENDKNLATAFALLALAHCEPLASKPVGVTDSE